MSAPDIRPDDFVTNPPCRTCGGPVNRPTYNNNARYCNDECAVEFHKAKRKELLSLQVQSLTAMRLIKSIRDDNGQIKDFIVVLNKSFAAIDAFDEKYEG